MLITVLAVPLQEQLLFATFGIDADNEEATYSYCSSQTGKQQLRSRRQQATGVRWPMETTQFDQSVFFISTIKELSAYDGSTNHFLKGNCSVHLPTCDFILDSSFVVWDVRNPNPKVLRSYKFYRRRYSISKIWIIGLWNFRYPIKMRIPGLI